MMYKKAIENDLNANITEHLIEVISHHMKNGENRNLILDHLDLCKVFAVFTNIYLSPKDGKSEGKIERCSVIIEMLLSQFSTLFHLITERATLKNFIVSLKSKTKNERELSICNNKIFVKLIDKAMRYDRNKMERSNNSFGLSSNYLNYNKLLGLSFLLESTEIFDIYLSCEPKGSLFPGLGQATLTYFPVVFEKGKYIKSILQTIELCAANEHEALSRDFLSILSYYNDSLIQYSFTSYELLSYLLEIKGLKCYQEEFEPECRQSIENLFGVTKVQHSADLN
jgi:hypothetical protein